VRAVRAPSGSSADVGTEFRSSYGLIIKAGEWPMRKLLILAILALSVAGGLTAYSTLSAEPAHADCNGC
jgi:hypothetical protein